MTPLALGIASLDLGFLGRPRAILTGVVHGADGLALIDPGPASCLTALEQGLRDGGFRLEEVTHLLLTHIHLDHAGSAGAIVRRSPGVSVLVHERGATHLIDPSRLVGSATRLWGADMERLWGTTLPVPESRVQVLEGGERVSVAGRTFDVAYTPGHAAHHVSFFEPSAGLAFVGDTAGVFVEGGYVLPPTPPPDIDLELWRGSVDRIEAWAPQTLFLTHGGPVSAVRPHLRALLDNLETTALLARGSLARATSDAERCAWFVDQLRRELRRTLTEDAAAAYELTAPFDLLWLGLARYWRKRAERAEPGAS